jgi:hypothetical protein
MAKALMEVALILKVEAVCSKRPIAQVIINGFSQIKAEPYSGFLDCS